MSSSHYYVTTSCIPLRHYLVYPFTYYIIRTKMNCYTPVPEIMILYLQFVIRCSIAVPGRYIVHYLNIKKKKKRKRKEGCVTPPASSGSHVQTTGYRLLFFFLKNCVKSSRWGVFLSLSLLGHTERTRQDRSPGPICL